MLAISTDGNTSGEKFT